MTKLAPDTRSLMQDSFNPVQKRASLAPTSEAEGPRWQLGGFFHEFIHPPSIHPSVHQSSVECLQCANPVLGVGILR